MKACKCGAVVKELEKAKEIIQNKDGKYSNTKELVSDCIDRALEGLHESK